MFLRGWLQKHYSKWMPPLVPLQRPYSPLDLPTICWRQWWLQCGICHGWNFCSRLKDVVRYIAEAALLRVWYWDVTDVLGGKKKLVERVAEVLEAQESCRCYLLRLLRASKLLEGVQHTTLRPGTGASVTVSLRRRNDWLDKASKFEAKDLFSPEDWRLEP